MVLDWAVVSVGSESGRGGVVSGVGLGSCGGSVVGGSEVVSGGVVSSCGWLRRGCGSGREYVSCFLVSAGVRSELVRGTGGTSDRHNIGGCEIVACTWPRLPRIFIEGTTTTIVWVTRVRSNYLFPTLINSFIQHCIEPVI